MTKAHLSPQLHTATFSNKNHICCCLLFLFLVSLVLPSHADTQDVTNNTLNNFPTSEQIANTEEAKNIDDEILTIESELEGESGINQPITPEASEIAEHANIGSTLPHDLTPMGMFNASDPIVKAIMLLLALASLATWTVLVAKSLEMFFLNRLLKKNLEHLSHARTLSNASEKSSHIGVGAEIIKAAENELHLSANLSTNENYKSGVKERVASSLSRIEINTARKMLAGTGLLATIGAVSPFIGLFGTVWGIMNSFIGISQANTTNLAVVAPGIAEALLATALGLVAAIPAVIIYNYFTRKISATKQLVSDISASVMRLISRDLDQSLASSTNKLKP